MQRRPSPTRLLPQPSSIDPPRPSSLIAGAAAFAAAELAFGLAVLNFFEWGRAEALLFFALRPWLLLIGAWCVARFGWRRRLAFYALALGLAGLGESLLLLPLGGDPWIEMLRGWAAGALAAALIDALLQLGWRLWRRAGQGLAAALVVVLLLLPGGQGPYEALALGPTGSRPVAHKPPLLLMSALPLVWGETGPFDPESRPAAAYRALRDEFDVRPIDYLDAAALRRGRLMLLAQPRALAPEELVGLDAWVRGGGRILILADPDLTWPSELPLGDLRHAPAASLLSPLLEHWGLRLEPSPGRRFAEEALEDGGDVRRLALETPGRFVVTGRACRTSRRDFVAYCAIGSGRALLVADADLLRDDLWARPGARGSERHARLADNPLVVAGWLDRLAGLQRERAARAVHWRTPQANRGLALILASLPILAALAASLALRLRRG